MRDIGHPSKPTHRPLHCHPEHIRFTQCKFREGSVALGKEILRCAQDDRVVIHRDAWINLLISIMEAHTNLYRYERKNPVCT